MPRSSIALAWLVAASAAAAQPWTPSPCSAEATKRWLAYEHALRAAGPGSTLYVPKPFPKTLAEIAADYEYRESLTWKDEPLNRIPARNRPIVAGIRNGTLVYEVERVEEWAPGRCLSERPYEYYTLLRIREKAGGPIIARAAVRQDGHWAMSSYRPDDEQIRVHWDPAVPTLAAALAEVKAAYGLSGQRAQYVATWGDPRCSPDTPCVAFQANGRSYVRAHNGELYEFGPGSREHSYAEVMWDRAASLKAGLEEGEEVLMSVGHDRWVVARRVPRRH